MAQIINHTSIPEGPYLIRDVLEEIREKVTVHSVIEESRPFACLKPWASLKILGRDGYRLLSKQAREAIA